MTLGRCPVTVAITLIVLALAGCGREREPAPPPRDEATSAAALPDSSAQLADLLPATNQVAGWLLPEKPRFYGPGNLWEFIDGAAEGYLTYGFQEVVSADFSQSGRELVVDVYRMKDSVNAFGIYTQERNPDARPVTIGAEGSLSATALTFWAGPYYVKITAFDEQAETRQAMERFAALVSGRIGDGGSRPDEITWFPTENLVPRSVAYIPKDVLGQSYFADAFEARYQAGRQQYRILAIDLQHPEAAAKALAAYRAFQAGSGKTPRDPAAPGSDEGFTGADRFYGLAMAVRSGRYVVIALGVPSPAVGSGALKEVLSHIPRKGEVP